MLQYQIFHHVVSIHAPYAGSDLIKVDFLQFCISFNPRPLCRERPERITGRFNTHLFQSTPPMQGATLTAPFRSFSFRVSIHAPYAGSDGKSISLFLILIVSIHAPYAGSDENRGERPGAGKSFNPRPLCRERHQQLILLLE